ncbi:MAG: Phospho-2-dehydro-3-deoxyheptonate aldolase [Lentisphaerae bacterium ADurb.BinA184]|nr:MAG: Phospho-2-dehydro-3-deoxyheptonate aldolase [Lentisphaerae bacterium ADurb.BinA184]
MIIVLTPHASDQQVEEVKRHVIDLGYDPRVIRGVERTIIGAVGDELSHRSLEMLKGLPMVENVLPIQKRYKLASREFHAVSSVVHIGRHAIGQGQFQMLAGPCSIESREQLREATRDLVAAGVRVIRAGAYKPRTSPYDFQGLGEKGLELLAEVKHDFDVAVVTEVVGSPHVQRVAAVADLLQIGARNCQNYHLLEVVADAGKPVLLKRGMASTIEEWLSAAEYLLVHGCPGVILCERGIRTFETATRNTLDVGAVAVAKQESHLPVIVDPSHAAGTHRLILPLAKAGVAAGADGLIIEAHPDPVNALSDAAQQLPTADFASVMAELRPLIEICGKHMA